MAASVWKGMLTFGLVSIPIKLYVAARPKRTALHQLHRDCHTRLKQPLFCPHCNRFVDRSEVVKGYEYEKGKYVVIEPDEIKKITPASGHNMEILAFVKETEVDPVYFETSFLSVPDAEGAKGYKLLLTALEETKMVGIAKVTMHQREYTVFIRPRDNGLTLHTMFYVNEIAHVAQYGKDNVKVTAQEVKLAQQLVATLAAHFKPEQYHDDFQVRLNALIEAKLKGKTIAVAPEAAPAPVIDMMEALKRSLAATSKGAKPAKNAPKPKIVAKGSEEAEASAATGSRAHPRRRKAS
jgi:DNA end-binding protein Ku